MSVRSRFAWNQEARVHLSVHPREGQRWTLETRIPVQVTMLVTRSNWKTEDPHIRLQGRYLPREVGRIHPDQEPIWIEETPSNPYQRATAIGLIKRSALPSWSRPRHPWKCPGQAPTKPRWWTPPSLQRRVSLYHRNIMRGPERHRGRLHTIKVYLSWRTLLYLWWLVPHRVRESSLIIYKTGLVRALTKMIQT